MKAPDQSNVFLERSVYRRRRLIDAIRILPAFAAVFFLVPLVWGGEEPDAAGHVETANAMIYLFGVWIAVIILAALAGYFLTSDRQADQ